MPDIASALRAAIEFVSVCDANLINDFLTRADLIRAHNQKLLIGVKHAVFSKDI